jgi:hypothetical protein
MDPVDILTMAVVAAQAIRSASAPEAVLSGAYRTLGREPPMDRDESMAIRVARLMTEAGESKGEVMAYLRSNAGLLFMNRPLEDEDRHASALLDPDPEAQRLHALLDAGGLEGWPMMPAGWGPFEIAGRKMVGHFDRELAILTEDGGRKSRWFDTTWVPAREAISEVTLGELPLTVRGLINYPLDVPLIFTIETGSDDLWSLWDICCAFAEQYDRIYEHPEHYGVWGHDLTDLWIERLMYYPEERLIDAFIGS